MDSDEYERLYQEFAAAVERAARVLRKKGMDSREFWEADTEAGKLSARLRELRRTADGEGWMVIGRALAELIKGDQSRHCRYHRSKC
jgi:hypothetical protein